MPWTKDQRRLAGIACRNAGMGDEHRQLVLRQFVDVRTGRCRAQLPDGRISSTADGLTNADFEDFMATVESFAGGQVKAGPHRQFAPGHFGNKAADHLDRVRHQALRMSNNLELDLPSIWPRDGAGLRGFIRRTTKQAKQEISDLTYDELHGLINAMRAIGRRHGLDLERRAGDCA